MKKLYTTLLLIATTISTWAYDVKVDGIYYYLDSLNCTAEVTNDGISFSLDQDYSGDIVIPDTIDVDGVKYAVTCISGEAFGYCTDMTSVTIGNCVESIDDTAFAFCSGLTSIVIPKSVKNIESDAFEYCFGLESITVEEGNAFYDCRDNCNAIIETATNNLVAGCKNTVIPNTVTSIGDCSFGDCTSLTSITLPETVTSIGKCAFDGCTGLTSIEIPASVTSMGDNAFSGCNGLESMTVDPDNTVYDSRDNCNAIIETATNALFFGCVKTKIPNTVTTIENDAFYNCTKLTSITIPESVTTIRFLAFDNCEGLDSVVIGSSIKSIEAMAFSDCTSLKTVVCYAEEIPEMDNCIFDRVDLSTAKLKVPAGSVEAYKAADQWKDFGKIEAIETTAIRAVEDNTISHSVCYSISGMKVRQTNKGVFIINGKKVIR